MVESRRAAAAASAYASRCGIAPATSQRSLATPPTISVPSGEGRRRCHVARGAGRDPRRRLRRRRWCGRCGYHSHLTGGEFDVNRLCQQRSRERSCQLVAVPADPRLQTATNNRCVDPRTSRLPRRPHHRNITMHSAGPASNLLLRRAERRCSAGGETRRRRSSPAQTCAISDIAALPGDRWSGAQFRHGHPARLGIAVSAASTAGRHPLGRTGRLGGNRRRPHFPAV